MKKTRQMIVVVMMVLLMVCSGFLWNKAEASEKERMEQDKKIVALEKSYPAIYDSLNSVTYDSFVQAIQSEEPVYVYVGRPSCGDCQDFEPEFINMIARENLGKRILYLNVHSIRQNEEAWASFKETHNVQYTPTLAKFESGSLTSKVEWTPETGINMNDVEQWIKDNIN